MKSFLVALSLIAVCSGSLVAWGPGGLSPWSAYPWSHHLTYAAAPAPYAYWPQHHLVVAAPAPVIQPGYVAATRGSLHIAPLPGNTPLASHHINLEPAPGTV